MTTRERLEAIERKRVARERQRVKELRSIAEGLEQMVKIGKGKPWRGVDQ